MSPQSREGFTLIELMIVITIIGILSAALYPSLSGYLERARLVNIISFERDMRNRGETIMHYDFESIDGFGGVSNEGPNSDGNYNIQSPSTGECTELISYGSGAVGLGESGFFSSRACLGTTDIVQLSGSDFSVMHWIKTTSVGGQTYTVLNTSGADGFRFGIDNGQIIVLLGASFSYYEGLCGTTPNLNDNRWHHIAAEFLGTQSEIHCFYDGKKVGTVAIGDGYGNFENKQVYIGNDPWGVGLSTGTFSGEIDNVYVVREGFY